jgi:hypothetical protein
MKVKRAHKPAFPTNVSFFYDTLMADAVEFNGGPLKYKDRAAAETAVGNRYIRMHPETEVELEHFYDACTEYFDVNVHFNIQGGFKQRAGKLLKAFKQFDVKSVCEVGIGVGTHSLMLAQQGYNVTVTASKDKAFDFFLWRLEKYSVPIRIVQKLTGKFDCVFFLDVIEHVWDPLEFIDAMAMHSNMLLFTQAFGWHDPEHPEYGGYPYHSDFSFHKVQMHLHSLGYHKQKLQMAFPPHVYRREATA